jgi:hypothetical protein
MKKALLTRSLFCSFLVAGFVNASFAQDFTDEPDLGDDLFPEEPEEESDTEGLTEEAILEALYLKYPCEDLSSQGKKALLKATKKANKNFKRFRKVLNLDEDIIDWVSISEQVEEYSMSCNGDVSEEDEDDFPEFNPTPQPKSPKEGSRGGKRKKPKLPPLPDDGNDIDEPGNEIPPNFEEPNDGNNFFPDNDFDPNF